MLICQQNADLQPSMDTQDGIDWTLAAHSYPNIEEAPSFISQQRQAAGQHVFTTSTCRGSSSRCTPSSSTTSTSEDDCLQHSWHREVLPHPLPSTSPATPAAGCSSNLCGRLQHRWPDPPLPPQPAHQRRVQGPGGRETHQAAAGLLRGQVSHH